MRLWRRRRVYVDNLPPTHDLRFATVFLLGFLVVIAGLYAAGHLAVGDRLPVGTTVAGIDVGGMKPGQATTTLQDSLAPRLERRITATVLNRTFSIDPQRAGMTFDLEATIDAGLQGSSWDPRHMLHVLAGGDSLEPVLDVDQAELNATLRRIAAVMDRRAVDASVSFDSGLPTLVYAQEGRALDLARSRERLRAALVAGDSTVTFPLDNVDPTVSSGQAATFLSGVARPAVSAPVSIGVADTTVVVRPKTYAAALRTQTHDGRIRLLVDADQLYARSRGLIRALPYQPVNAAIVFRNGRPQVVPSRSGVSVGASDWAAAVLRAVGKDAPARRASVRIRPDPPPFTTGDARMLRLRQAVASATVPAVSGHLAALQQAAAQLDGTLVLPRKTFSFLGHVTTTDVVADSALASGVYRAALTAGMSDIVRTPEPVHPLTTADGMDAYVVAATTDLQWQNSTPYGGYLHAWVSTGGGRAAAVHVQLWSSPYWSVTMSTSGRHQVTAPQVERVATPGCVPRRGVPGFEVDVTRTSATAGQPRRVETFHSSYSPLDAIVCHGSRVA